MINKQVTQAVYFVGGIDWNMRDFHGFCTPKGVTYNSYVVMDEKIAVIDGVKHTFADEQLSKIANIVDPEKIDYIIVNHVEPDHSGGLPVLARAAKNAVVVCTAQGKDEITKYYGSEFNFKIVKAGDSIELGKNKLHFLPLPMVHWPDSMASFLEGEDILFSNDAFGQHLCSSKLFDDENDLAEVLFEAEKYYANILMPLGKQVAGALDKVSQLQFTIKIVAPSHGVIWRSHIGAILKKYAEWSAGMTSERVVIVYETMWGSTEILARALMDGVVSEGIKVNFYRLNASDRTEIVRDILTAKGIMIGSSTIHNGVLPNVGALLYQLKGLRPVGKIAAVFGTYGWAGGAVKEIDKMLAETGIEVKHSIGAKWAPNNDELKQAFEIGAEFARLIKLQ
ncbi:MAG: FprA family A-type flavoprotein [Negativicutes bacterium]